MTEERTRTTASIVRLETELERVGRQIAQTQRVDPEPGTNRWLRHLMGRRDVLRWELKKAREAEEA